MHLKKRSVYLTALQALALILLAVLFSCTVDALLCVYRRRTC